MNFATGFRPTGGRSAGACCTSTRLPRAARPSPWRCPACRRAPLLDRLRPGDTRCRSAPRGRDGRRHRTFRPAGPDAGGLCGEGPLRGGGERHAHPDLLAPRGALLRQAAGCRNLLPDPRPRALCRRLRLPPPTSGAPRPTTTMATACPAARSAGKRRAATSAPRRALRRVPRAARSSKRTTRCRRAIPARWPARSILRASWPWSCASGASPPTPRTDIPRVGVRMRLPAAAGAFRYFGRGPAENYWDRCAGSRPGEYRSTASAEYFPYVRPQECGHHTDCTELTLGGVTFVADSLFEFNVLRNAVEDFDSRRPSRATTSGSTSRPTRSTTPPRRATGCPPAPYRRHLTARFCRGVPRPAADGRRGLRQLGLASRALAHALEQRRPYAALRRGARGGDVRRAGPAVPLLKSENLFHP